MPGNRFIRTACAPIPALRIELQRFRHPSGAEHWHLACDDEHRAFAVAFRTPPADDTGLPHILEHTALCGSRRFPVRDPFFRMLRRSLQTFMNAMTYPDLTCYPFATQVAKDYANLLAVYVDAVFRPRLERLDFAQEGHRLEPEGASWARKGVVFNEMKGAMDGTDEQLEVAKLRALMPATIYRFNSGGEPAAIPRLAHADLVAFHRDHYAAANACFVTYGAADPDELHALVEPYLAERAGRTYPPPELQPPLPRAQRLEVPVPLGEDQDPVDVAAAELTWTWGDASDLDEALMGELLDRLMVGHAGAPLRHALESSGLGRSAAGSGYGASYRNGLFSAALEGIDPADYGKFPPLVERTVAEVAERGFPADEVTAALHQLELERREIRGDHYPFGLELCLRTVAAWNTGRDPLPALDQGPGLERLRLRATPDALRGEIRRRLVDNPHSALLLAVPDREFHVRAERLEREQVERDLATLGPAGQERLRAEAAELAAHQARSEDEELLPKLVMADVPRERRWAEGRPVPCPGGELTVFTPGTNAILHHLVATPIPDLGEDEFELLPLVARTIGAVGVGPRDYAAQAAYLNARCGGLGAGSDLVADVDDIAALRGFLVWEVKGLADRHRDFLPLIAETAAGQRFDEHARLAELVEQSLQRLQERVQSSGSALAASAAMRGFGGAAALGFRLSGLGRLLSLKRQAAGLADDAPDAAKERRSLAERLARLYARLNAQPRHLALIGDAAAREDVLAGLRAAWPAPATARDRGLRALAVQPTTPTAYTTGAAVNHCALAFRCVAAGHGDAPALAVAGRYLTNGFLHPRLREQGGAYGGGANYSSGTGCFTLTSYRDPRFAETMADMRESLQWLAAIGDEERPLREAILGVIAGVDAPASPAGEARARFTADLKGMGPARINAFRRAILAVTPADLRRVATTWLRPELGVPAAVTSAETLAASKLGWDAVAL